MGTPRMTAKSARAIEAADQITLVGFESRPGAADWRYAVHGLAQGRMFAVINGDGYHMLYPSVAAAETAVRRHNKAVPIRVKYSETTAA